MKTVLLWLAMASMVNAGDVWLITPAGYYVTALDADGVPITTPAIGVTGHQFMGAPDSPIPPPPDPPAPTDDQWGLVALSEAEAEKVNDPNDPKNATGGKVGGAYQEVGKLVQAGTIPKNRLEAVLQMAFNAATGDSKAFWQPWKDKTQAAYNADTINFKNATEAGQGVIDIGLGASRSSNAAIGPWLQFFIEVLLPWILKFIDSLPASAFEATA
jgi:hypothetical protein